MEKQEIVRIDNIDWWVWKDKLENRHVQPLCPKHRLRMYPLKHSYMAYSSEAKRLKCEDCGENYHNLSRSYSDEESYVLNRIDAKIFRHMKVLNLDDEAIPLSEEKIKKDSKYFITSVLTESKVGKRLIIYSGKKGEKQKTQIFIEPELKRLAFDQKDLHPNEVFAKVEATFVDGTKASQEKKA